VRGKSKVLCYQKARLATNQQTFLNGARQMIDTVNYQLAELFHICPRKVEGVLK
jgi:hypothetical protein